MKKFGLLFCVLSLGAAVSVANAFDLSQIVGTTTVATDTENWRIAAKPKPVPCRVYAGQFGGASAEMDVANAPADCAPQPPPPPANSATAAPGDHRTPSSTSSVSWSSCS